MPTTKPTSMPRFSGFVWEPSTLRVPIAIFPYQSAFFVVDPSWANNVVNDVQNWIDRTGAQYVVKVQVIYSALDEFTSQAALVIWTYAGNLLEVEQGLTGNIGS